METWILYFICVALCLLLGGLLAQYCRVLAMIPATICLIAAGVTIGILQKASGLVILEGIIWPWVALDAGYVLGLAFKYWKPSRGLTTHWCGVTL